ncbi:NAD(P)/FAD-dependent oxidoreductase [Marinomonas ostreistagni]|uniref:NAD(P)/FAD-dependent oxidoreductase n=1 Tax=Marinomonas ostreistagni TaxID=359209 RepID=UPI00194FA210|nr:FAD-binding oxidoreductase [Marinomonas ostreistagni]MBM6552088.1 FAD-binding oxidoreductase [Marinomonas ostreistagni]
MAEFIVLGAGMVGVSSALALQQAGHDVVIVDRTEPGLETSFGNAGIIQTEAAEPYALPQDMATLLRYATGKSNDVTWDLAASLKMAPALWRYYRNSSGLRYQTISKVYAQLAARATADHQPLIEASQSEAMIKRDGLAMLYRDEASFREATQRAERMLSEYGVTSRIVDGLQYMAEEPALKQAPIGAVHWLQSWSCSDPGALTQAYAQLFVARGGHIARGDANSLQQSTLGWSVDTTDGRLSAAHVVVALGPWSPQLLKRFGYHIPMVYKRGYHGHYKPQQPLKRPFLDVANGVLAAPMTGGIRVTTGAALVDMAAPANTKQLKRGVEQLGNLLSLGARVRESQWYGTRPCMPDMLPLVGAAPKHQNMWFHFGHGHQGFTQGPTTALLLSELIAGQVSSLTTALSPARLV